MGSVRTKAGHLRIEGDCGFCSPTLDAQKTSFHLSAMESGCMAMGNKEWEVGTPCRVPRERGKVLGDNYLCITMLEERCKAIESKIRNCKKWYGVESKSMVRSIINY